MRRIFSFFLPPFPMRQRRKTQTRTFGRCDEFETPSASLFLQQNAQLELMSVFWPFSRGATKMRIDRLSEKKWQYPIIAFFSFFSFLIITETIAGWIESSVAGNHATRDGGCKDTRADSTIGKGGNKFPIESLSSGEKSKLTNERDEWLQFHRTVRWRRQKSKAKKKKQ